MRIALASTAFAALLLLTGCSADDVVGPEFADGTTNTVTRVSGPSPIDNVAPASFEGTWVATGSKEAFTVSFKESAGISLAADDVTTFIGEASLMSASEIGVASFRVVEGRASGRDFTFALVDADGETYAKAKAAMNVQFSGFDAYFVYADGREGAISFARK